MTSDREPPNWSGLHILSAPTEILYWCGHWPRVNPHRRICVCHGNRISGGAMQMGGGNRTVTQLIHGRGRFVELNPPTPVTLADRADLPVVR